MKRRFQGLASTAQPNTEVPDGVFLIRVDQVRYSRERQKPFYTVRFSVLEPEPLAGRIVSGRLYCTTKALWKFSWLLRDFGYDPELVPATPTNRRVCWHWTPNSSVIPG